MVFTLVFRDKLDCRVYRTLGRHHMRSLQTNMLIFCCFFVWVYIASIGFHCIGTGWQYNATLHETKCHRSLCQHGVWVENGWNFSFEWTIPLSKIPYTFTLINPPSLNLSFPSGDCFKLPLHVILRFPKSVTFIHKASKEHNTPCVSMRACAVWQSAFR